MEYSEMSKDLQRKVDQYHRTVPDQTLAGLTRVFKGEANGDGGLGVTLTVGGSLISGITVSERAWAEAVGHLDSDVIAPISKALLETLDNREQEPELSEEARDAMDDEEALAHLIKWQSQFIHLVDAHQLVGERLVPQEGVPMRIRLSEVQGWSFGNMEKSEG